MLECVGKQCSFFYVSQPADVGRVYTWFYKQLPERWSPLSMVVPICRRFSRRNLEPTERANFQTDIGIDLLKINIWYLWKIIFLVFDPEETIFDCQQPVYACSAQNWLGWTKRRDGSWSARKAGKKFVDLDLNLNLSAARRESSLLLHFILFFSYLSCFFVCFFFTQLHF